MHYKTYNAFTDNLIRTIKQHCQFIFTNTNYQTSIQLNMPYIKLYKPSTYIITDTVSQNTNLVSDFSALPIENSSIDCIVCPDVLNRTNINMVLNECHRILKPTGIILIVSFNQHSLLGLCIKHGITLTYLKEQLIVSGFSIDQGWFLNYMPPINSTFCLKKLSWLNQMGNRWWPQFANMICIAATKQEICQTFVQPSYDITMQIAI